MSICVIEDKTVTRQHHDNALNTEPSIVVNIFDVIEENPAKAIELQALSDLMILVRDVIDENHWTDSKAAKKLGITPAYVRNITQGRIDRLSIKKLVYCLYQSGHRITSTSTLV